MIAAPPPAISAPAPEQEFRGIIVYGDRTALKRVFDFAQKRGWVLEVATFPTGDQGLVIRQETREAPAVLKKFFDDVNAKRFGDLTAGMISTEADQ